MSFSDRTRENHRLPESEMKLRSILACLLFTVAPAARALTPYRVADVDPTFHSGGSAPDHFVRVGQRVVFTASNPSLGLWSSDGRSAGAIRLAGNQTQVSYVAATGDALFFVGCDSQGCRFQVTNGTRSGTRALPGLTATATGVAVAGARRIFFGGRAPAGPELWTSDGTPGGTRLVKRFELADAATTLHGFVWIRDHLLFFTSDALWISDGRTAGTRKIATVGIATLPAIAGSKLVFYTTTDGSKFRLWSSDGTAQGTKKLGFTRSDPSTLAPFASAGGDAFFSVLSPTFESQLWATDGTAAHTRKLATFQGLGSLVGVGSRLAFIATDEAHGTELWMSDGRPGGTRRIDICPGECSSVEENIGAVDGNRIWFAASSNDGEELWTSDLTAAGTRQVKDLVPGSQSSFPRKIIAGGGRAYFATGDRDFSYELWVSDGTAAGTRRLAMQDDPDRRSLAVLPGAIAGGHAFFRLADASHGSEPWVTDGTVAGTALIADLAVAQDGGSFPEALMPIGNRCFFFPAVFGDDTYNELWVSDGSQAGTSLAYRFDSEFDIGQGVNVNSSVELGGRLALFHLGEIWVSDGTSEGTVKIHSSEVESFGPLRSVAGRLFFTAEDGEHDSELWSSDGSPEGTVRLTDFVNPSPFFDPNESHQHGLVELAGGVAFLAADEFGRVEPWFSDGTVPGTRHLAEVYPALAAPFFDLSSDVVAAGGRIFFLSGNGPRTLWVSDLTAAGTRSLGSIVDEGGSPAFLTSLFALGDRVLVFYLGSQGYGFRSSDGTGLSAGALVYFDNRLPPVKWGGRLAFLGVSANDPDPTLYVTDGTATGTIRLKFPDGGRIFGVTQMDAIGGRLAFVSPTGIWETDGTPAGTVRRLAPYRSSALQDFVRAGQRIFFPWYDAQAGTELWALRP